MNTRMIVRYSGAFSDVIYRKEPAFELFIDALQHSIREFATTRT